MAVIKIAQNGFVLDGGERFWIARSVKELLEVVQEWAMWKDVGPKNIEPPIEEIQKKIEEAGGKPPSPKFPSGGSPVKSHWDLPPNYGNRSKPLTGGTERSGVKEKLD